MFKLEEQHNFGFKWLYFRVIELNVKYEEKSLLVFITNTMIIWFIILVLVFVKGCDALKAVIKSNIHIKLYCKAEMYKSAWDGWYSESHGRHSTYIVLPVILNENKKFP